MSVAGDTALFFAPAEDGNGPGGPAFGFEAFGAGIGLIVEVQQADVAERLGAEAADFEVVFEDGERLAEVAGLGLEELPLIAVTRAPREDRADVEAFAF